MGPALTTPNGTTRDWMKWSWPGRLAQTWAAIGVPDIGSGHQLRAHTPFDDAKTCGAGVWIALDTLQHQLPGAVQHFMSAPQGQRGVVHLVDQDCVGWVHGSWQPRSRS